MAVIALSAKSFNRTTNRPTGWTC